MIPVEMVNCNIFQLPQRTCEDFSPCRTVEIVQNDRRKNDLGLKVTTY